MTRYELDHFRAALEGQLSTVSLVQWTFNPRGFAC